MKGPRARTPKPKARVLEGDEVGLLEDGDFGEPAGLDEGGVVGVGGVGVVVGLGGEFHGDAEGVVELGADLAADGEVADAGEVGEFGGGGEEGGFFGGAWRVLEAEGDGVLDHCREGDGLEKVAREGADAAEGFGVGYTAGGATVAGEGGFGLNGGVFGGVEGFVAHVGHEAAEPFLDAVPFLTHIDVGVGGEVDGVAGAVVVPEDLGGGAGVVFAGESGGLEEGSVADGGGGFVIGMAVVAPEHEGGVGLDLGDDLGDFAFDFEGVFEAHAGVFEEAHFDASVGGHLDGFIEKALLATFDRRPVGVVADEAEDDDAMVGAYGFEQDAGDAEGAVVVVGAEGEEGFGHRGAVWGYFLRGAVLAAGQSCFQAWTVSSTRTCPPSGPI